MNPETLKYIMMYEYFKTTEQIPDLAKETKKNETV